MSEDTWGPFDNEAEQCLRCGGRVGVSPRDENPCGCEYPALRGDQATEESRAFTKDERRLLILLITRMLAEPDTTKHVTPEEFDLIARVTRGASVAAVRDPNNPCGHGDGEMCSSCAVPAR